MAAKAKTTIVTEAACGVGAGITKAFVERGYNALANSLQIAQSGLEPSTSSAFVEGDVAKPSTASSIVDAAVSKFGLLDGVINNSGIFFTMLFAEYTTADFERSSCTNLPVYIYLTQLAVKKTLAQQIGGSVISITSAIVDHPVAGVNAPILMIAKGALDAVPELSYGVM